MKKLFSVLCLVFLLQQIRCHHLGDVFMSATYSGYGPLFAIDGKYPTDTAERPEICNCCSITEGTGTLWWTIDFGYPRIFEEITITGRKNLQDQYQSKNLSIFTSNTRVAQTDGQFGDMVWHINTSTPGYIFRHVFQPPRLFQYLSITRQGVVKNYMTICEVDFVTSECLPGQYGINCSETCGNCKVPTMCLTYNGTCPEGCAPGYDITDTTCKTECQPGHYGINCLQTCGHCIHGATRCSVIDGMCTDGCISGYDPADVTCKRVCRIGQYGAGCKERCGNCKVDTSCMPADGMCSAECAPGYNYTADKRCKIACKTGHYGYNCVDTCGHCIGGTTACSVVNGTCPAGCVQGYSATDHTCKTVCQSGHYGFNCKETCGQCYNGTTCSITNGQCPAGCSPGFHYTANATCKQMCQSGHYGFNCKETCGQCYNGTTCSITNGECPAGCSPGFDYTVNATCKQTCHKGFYGLNCSDTCGNCINETECLFSNGTCLAGCAPGYTHNDKTCKTECESGNYGFNCTYKCGHCRNGNTTCNKTDGACSHGCASGYVTDKSCTTECQPGQYGVECSESCGNCIHGNSNCSSSDGTCPTGCTPGYSYIADKTCKTECKDGHYGAECSKNCSNNCRGENTTCFHVDGRCLTGCGPGFDYTAAMTCDLECMDGTYGINCSQACGLCGGGPTKCSKIDGICLLRQCDAGFTGERCQEDVRTPIAGVLTGVIVPAIVVVVLVVVLKLREYQSKRLADRSDHEYLARERENQQKQEHTETHDKQSNAREDNGYYTLCRVTNGIQIRDLWDYINRKRASSFEDIFVEFRAVPSRFQFECSAATRVENVGKNKYRNMYPYDHCRVKLKVPEGRTDYINASHVNGYERKRKFIAAQGPQIGTIDDFWLMIWQLRVKEVVMLTNIIETGKDKCEQYWPNEGTSVHYGGIRVTLKETEEKHDYIIRRLELRMEHKKSRRINQFHFVSWPDKDVPDSAWCLVNFWRVVMDNDEGKYPILVHCSAGIGRTGTFIALDVLYQQALAESSVRPVDVIETLRKQRNYMVQTKYQYAYLHEALAEALLVGTHFYWANQMPAVSNFFKGRNSDATVTRAQDQYKYICKCISPSGKMQQLSAAEHVYEYAQDPMAEPEYENISTLQVEISEYRPKTENRNSAFKNQMNAIYLPNYAEATTYILAETPFDSSLPDFWSLVDEQNVITIVKLTETTHPYYQTSCTLGSSGGQPVGRFIVNGVEEVLHKRYTIRSILYKDFDKEDSNAGVTIKLFSLPGWQPGAQCPSDIGSLITLLVDANTWQPYVSEANPVLFICGNGRTRCGLVAAIFNECQRMRNDEGHVNIVETVLTMKRRTRNIISDEQFQFLYETVFEYAKRIGFVVDNGNL